MTFVTSNDLIFGHFFGGGDLLGLPNPFELFSKVGICHFSYFMISYKIQNKMIHQFLDPALQTDKQRID